MPAERFAARARSALADDRLRASVARGTGAMRTGRIAALADLEDPDLLRNAARSARLRATAALPELLDTWSTRFEANGGRVHWALDAAEAVHAVAGIVAAAGGRTVVKGKSMASEEIALNRALIDAGLEVTETDLGEFIIQLADEPPSHLLAPALHKDRGQVSELFSQDAGHRVPADIPAEAAYARQRLRAAFLAGDVGVSGVNFAVAETGSIALVENEGNGRMVTSLPRVHIAVMGAERVVADLAELDLMLALLARSATGQALSVYTNLISGPRRVGEMDGPEQVHVVVVDNGRGRVLSTGFYEALSCIRCGACLNVCPVYRQVGGHAYGSVYSGPIGAVLTPLLAPDDPSARELPYASSLCGACTDACPVRIPLHDQLLGLRLAQAGDAGGVARTAMSGWAALWSGPAGFAASTALGRWLLRRAPRRDGDGRIGRRLPGWAGAWLAGRDVPRS